MAAMTLEQTMQRARAALAMPTLYWLELGGFTNAGAAPAAPGTRIDNIEQRLAQMQATDAKGAEKARKYRAGLAQTGLTIAQLPGVACDCSGFVTWALGIARHPSPIGWVNTDAMHRDATGAQTLFVRLPKAQVGALLVYPRPRNDEVGHVGLVSEVDGEGRATQVIHCAPENFLLEPGAGAPRNAIAETGTAHFDEQAGTVAVLFKGHS